MRITAIRTVNGLKLKRVGGRLAVSGKVKQELSKIPYGAEVTLDVTKDSIKLTPTKSPPLRVTKIHGYKYRYPLKMRW